MNIPYCTAHAVVELAPQEDGLEPLVLYGAPYNRKGHGYRLTIMNGPRKGESVTGLTLDVCIAYIAYRLFGGITTLSEQSALRLAGYKISDLKIPGSAKRAKEQAANAVERLERRDRMQKHEQATT